jgi:hypothetical protein
MLLAFSERWCWFHLTRRFSPGGEAGMSVIFDDKNYKFEFSNSFLEN